MTEILAQDETLLRAMEVPTCSVCVCVSRRRDDVAKAPSSPDLGMPRPVHPPNEHAADTDDTPLPISSRLIYQPTLAPLYHVNKTFCR